MIDVKDKKVYLRLFYMAMALRGYLSVSVLDAFHLSLFILSSGGNYVIDNYKYFTENFPWIIMDSEKKLYMFEKSTYTVPNCFFGFKAAMVENNKSSCTFNINDREINVVLELTKDALCNEQNFSDLQEVFFDEYIVKVSFGHNWFFTVDMKMDDKKDEEHNLSDFARGFNEVIINYAKLIEIATLDTRKKINATDNDICESVQKYIEDERFFFKVFSDRSNLRNSKHLEYLNAKIATMKYPPDTVESLAYNILVRTVKVIEGVDICVNGVEKGKIEMSTELLMDIKELITSFLEKGRYVDDSDAENIMMRAETVLTVSEMAMVASSNAAALSKFPVVAVMETNKDNDHRMIPLSVYAKANNLEIADKVDKSFKSALEAIGVDNLQYTCAEMALVSRNGGNMKNIDEKETEDVDEVLGELDEDDFDQLMEHTTQDKAKLHAENWNKETNNDDSLILSDDNTSSLVFNFCLTMSEKLKNFVDQCTKCFGLSQKDLKQICDILKEISNCNFAEYKSPSFEVDELNFAEVFNQEPSFIMLVHRNGHVDECVYVYFDFDDDKWHWMRITNRLNMNSKRFKETFVRSANINTKYDNGLTIWSFSGSYNKCLNSLCEEANVQLDSANNAGAYDMITTCASAMFIAFHNRLVESVNGYDQLVYGKSSKDAVVWMDTYDTSKALDGFEKIVREGFMDKETLTRLDASLEKFLDRNFDPDSEFNTMRTVDPDKLVVVFPNGDMVLSKTLSDPKMSIGEIGVLNNNYLPLNICCNGEDIFTVEHIDNDLFGTVKKLKSVVYYYENQFEEFLPKKKLRSKAKK